MRILFYNWVPFDDVEGRSGGVRVYQSNLIRHLARTTKHHIVIVSSGIEHDKFDQTLRFEPTSNELGDRVASYSFINSPVMAPGHHSFGSRDLFEEGEALSVWHDFLRDQGPFDVVHFDSLEGIPFTWLRVHEVSQGTRVLLYAHNYYSVCPQVNLWKREKRACTDYNEGADCATCLPQPVNPNDILRAHQLSRILRQARIRPGSRSYQLAYAVYARTKGLGVNGGLYSAATRGVLGAADAARRTKGALRKLKPSAGASQEARPLPSPTLQESDPRPADATTTAVAEPTSLKLAPLFKARREAGVALINREVDRVLATSHRTSEVLASYGIDPNKIEVAYIGTRAADAQDRGLRRTELRVPGKLSIAYLGYMRRDKGFLALIKALEKASPEFQSRIRLIVAAKQGPEDVMTRLTRLAQKLDDVLHYDGYKHSDLARILADADVGIVPVQWEDNLPQVAIEMVAHGLPIVTSDRGGAQELGGHNQGFVFSAESAESLVSTLESLADGTTPLRAYWDHAMDLWTMDAHSERLMKIYDPPTDHSAAERVASPASNQAPESGIYLGDARGTTTGQGGIADDPGEQAP